MRARLLLAWLALAFVACSDDKPTQQLGFGAGPGFTQLNPAVLPASTKIGGKSVATYTAPCAAGERLEWDGSAWQCRVADGNDYRGLHYEWNDDYLYQACNTNTAPCGSAFTQRSAGAGTGINGANVGASPARFGILDLTTGTTNTGVTALATTQNTFDFSATTMAVLEATVGFPTVSTAVEGYAAVIGFADAFNLINFDDGCYFLYDERNAATSGVNATNLNKLSCWAAKNTTRTAFLMDGVTVSSGGFTTVNAPVAALTLPNTNIYRLKITFDGTTCKFFVNGVESCRITANVPNAAAYTGAQVSILKSVGTTARSLYVDQTRIAIDLSAARSP